MTESESDPTNPQQPVPPPWPTARPGEPVASQPEPVQAQPEPVTAEVVPTDTTSTQPVPAPIYDQGDDTQAGYAQAGYAQADPALAPPAGQTGPPPWPTHPAPPASRSRKTPALIAMVGVVALVAGAGGAAIGVAVANNGSSSPSTSSFVAPSNPFGNSNGNGGSSSGNSEGGQFGGQSGSGSGSGTAGNVNIDVDGIAKKVNPAIVNIATTLSGGGEAAGTGMVLTSSGEVLTNNHVINGATKIQVEVGITGKTYTAKVVGYDVKDDVALIKLNNASGMKTISTDTSVSKNDKVVAVGNALGKFGTPAAVGGTVTALHQKVTAGDSSDGSDQETLSDMIRIAASIQPGDSGGALVNEDAQVIGMNTAADSSSGSSQFGGQFGSQTGTTGFAIPIGNALKIVNEIKDGDTSNGAHIGDRALLGVVLQDSSSNSPFDNGDSSGAAVSDVASDSPAANAGIGQGDTITAVGNTSVGSADELRSALETYHPGDKVSISWTDSSGDSHHASVTLTKGPPA